MLLLHNRPKNHATDKCGACLKPMPWRQLGETHAHSCHGCRLPLHGAGTKDCPVIQVEIADGMPLLYCSKKCANRNNKKRPRGGTKFLSQEAFPGIGRNSQDLLIIPRNYYEFPGIFY